MDCLSDDRMQARLLEESAASEDDVLDGHLRACGACRDRMRSLARFFRILRRPVPDDLGPDFEARFLSGLRLRMRAGAAGGAATAGRRRAGMALAMGLLVLVAGAIGLVRRGAAGPAAPAAGGAAPAAVALSDAPPRDRALAAAATASALCAVRPAEDREGLMSAWAPAARLLRVAGFHPADILGGLTEHPDDDVVIRVVTLLGALGRPESRGLLARVMERCQLRPAPRRAALLAMAALPGRTAFEAMVEAGARHATATERCEALAASGSSLAGPALVALIAARNAGSAEAEVRWLAAVPGRDTTEALVRKIVRTPLPEEAGWSAVEELGRRGDVAVRILSGEMRSLVAAGARTSAEAAVRAAELAGRLGAGGLVPELRALRAALPGSADVEDAVFAAWAAAGDGAALLALAECLPRIDAIEDPGASARIDRARPHFRRLGEGGARVLLGALDTRNADTRRAAVLGAGLTGSRGIVPVLSALLRRTDVRSEAIFALGEIGGDAAAAPLADLYERGGAVARREALRALERMGRSPARPVIGRLRG